MKPLELLEAIYETGEKTQHAQEIYGAAQGGTESAVCRCFVKVIQAVPLNTWHPSLQQLFYFCVLRLIGVPVGRFCLGVTISEWDHI